MGFWITEINEEADLLVDILKLNEIFSFKWEICKKNFLAI